MIRSGVRATEKLTKLIEAMRMTSRAISSTIPTLRMQQTIDRATSTAIAQETAITGTPRLRAKARSKATYMTLR